MQFPAGEPVPTARSERTGLSLSRRVVRYGWARAYTAADLRGRRMTLIQFWRTRCPALVSSRFPHLDALARAVGELTIPHHRHRACMEDSLSDIQRFYDRYNIRNLTIYQDRDHLSLQPDCARPPQPRRPCDAHDGSGQTRKDTISLRIPARRAGSSPRGDAACCRWYQGQCLEVGCRASRVCPRLVLWILLPLVLLSASA